MLCKIMLHKSSDGFVIYPNQNSQENSMKIHINITLSMTGQLADTLNDIKNGCFSSIGQFWTMCQWWIATPTNQISWF